MIGQRDVKPLAWDDQSVYRMKTNNDEWLSCAREEIIGLLLPVAVDRDPPGNGLLGEIQRQRLERPPPVVSLCRQPNTAQCIWGRFDAA